MSFIKISLGRIQGQNQKDEKGSEAKQTDKNNSQVSAAVQYFFIETSLYSFPGSALMRPEPVSI